MGFSVRRELVGGRKRRPTWHDVCLFYHKEGPIKYVWWSKKPITDLTDHWLLTIQGPRLLIHCSGSNTSIERVEVQLGPTCGTCESHFFPVHIGFGSRRNKIREHVALSGACTGVFSCMGGIRKVEWM